MPTLRNACTEPAPAPAIDEQVAAAMRSFREQQGLSLTALAKASGLSAAYLSRVENNLASLTLQNVGLVAQALGVAVSAFFEESPANRPLAHVRQGEGKIQRTTGRRALTMEVLAAEKRGKLMEPILVVIRPERGKPVLRSHPGEEFNHVIEGSCRLIFGKEEITLRVGDSVYYDATVPHAVQATGGKPCRLIAVVASRDYLFHGDLSKLLQLHCK